VTETLAARLTSQGTGAIATVAFRGPATWDIVRRLFRPRSDREQTLPDRPERNSVWLGRFGREAADEVVLAVKENEPLPWVEIHCHGGEVVVTLLLESLAQCGVRVCDPIEFFRFPIPPDPLRELARELLQRAPTARSAALLLGNCDGQYRAVVEHILHLLDTDNADLALGYMRAQLSYTQLGRHLIDPWKVVIAGAPNVGKSSLINALAGYQRSIVSPTPGTTRDVVTTTIALDGWPMELADTAGLRQQAAPLEGEGIARARTAATSADLCLWVVDAAAEPTWPDVIADRILLVVNKIDLPPTWDLNRAADAVRVSARTGAGIADLCSSVVRRLVPQAPQPGEAVPFTPALCKAIEEASAHLGAGRIDETRRVLAGLLEFPGGERR
jgi:tRNA modification GTPase